MGLWRDGDFLKLWAGRSVSEFGTLLYALQFIAVLGLEATPFQIGVIAALRIAPAAVVGFYAGVLADRVRRRPIIVVAHLGRFALLASIPAAYFAGQLYVEQLYAVALFQGILTAFADVAYRSYLPTLVRRRRLLEANSKLTGSESFAEVTAFSVGGWIAQLAGSIVLAAVDALMFLASAISLALIRKPEPEPDTPQRRVGMVRQIVEGLRMVWRNRLLRTLTAAETAEGFANGILHAVILLFGIRELGFGAGVLSTIFAVGAVSSLIGAFYTGRVARRFGVGKALMGGYAIYMLSILIMPMASGPMLIAGLALVLAQLGDGFYTIYDINQNSLRQAITPNKALGRVNASTRSLKDGAQFTGSLMGGLVAGVVGLRMTIVLAACVGIIGALYMIASPLRAVRELD